MRNESALLYSKMPMFKWRVKNARTIISRALEASAFPYVALSGGKDSTVVFSLVREFLPSVPAIWSDDEWFLPETLEYIQRLQSNGLDVRQIRTNAWHAEWLQVKGDWDGIPDYAKNQGYDAVFLGLRQDESSIRRVHLRKLGPLFLAKKDNVWHCNPIHDWTWQDVWAYIVSNNVDYNKAYDRLEAIGVEPEHQRIGPFAVESVLGYGQLVILKRGWPEMFNRFAAEHPEARAYA
jgi:3'-phosphoadenosine 5'-phosphosulfate sulfotransferase (PAPS reductase)/FAD synthetase